LGQSTTVAQDPTPALQHADVEIDEDIL
jgi:hypothetical protein